VSATQRQGCSYGGDPLAAGEVAVRCSNGHTHHLECLADIGHCAMPHLDGAVQPIGAYVDDGMQPLRTIWSTPAGS
jgi:hypothetical protein